MFSETFSLKWEINIFENWQEEFKSVYFYFVLIFLPLSWVWMQINLQTNSEYWNCPHIKKQTKQENISREHRLLPGISLLTYCLSFFSFHSGSVFSRVCIYLCMKLDFTLLSLYGLITSFTNTLSLLQKINEIPAFRWNVMLKWMVQKSIFRWLTPVWGRHDKCFMHINWRMMDLMIIP